MKTFHQIPVISLVADEFLVMRCCCSLLLNKNVVFDLIAKVVTKLEPEKNKN